jgi:hypothetical protein
MSENNINQQEKLYYAKRRDKTRLDNRRTMVDSATRELVGGSETGTRIEQTLSESNRLGGSRATNNSIRRGWNKGQFFGMLEVISRQNETWIKDISLIAGAFIGKGYENEVYLKKTANM